MNTKRTLLSLWVLLAYCTTLWAQLPTDGYAYRILSAAGDRAVTNADNGTAGAYLSMAAVDETSAGQLWTFYQVDNKDTYLVYNYTYGQAADMALTAAKSGVLLQWDPTCNSNQCFLVRLAEEGEGLVQLLCADDPTKAMTIQDDGSLLMATDLTAEGTRFRLEGTGEYHTANMPIKNRYYILTHHGSSYVLGNTDNILVLKLNAITGRVTYFDPFAE